jgi:hypothetical protein
MICVLDAEHPRDAFEFLPARIVRGKVPLNGKLIHKPPMSSGWE